MDAADADEGWRFRVEAIVDPQSLPRIAGFFAQRSLTPATLAMRITGDRMRIDVTVPGLDRARATIIAAKLGELYAVTDCRLDEPVSEPA